MTPPDPQQADRFAAARAVLENAIASRAFPGCAFGVLAGGEILVADALGRFTYEPISPAVTPETVYRHCQRHQGCRHHRDGHAASPERFARSRVAFGRCFTGVCRWPTVLKTTRETSLLRHLLAHNSGLPGYVEFFRTARNPAELLSACLQLPLEAEPGTRVRILRSRFHPPRQGP